MTATASKVLTIARKEIATKESPAGSNRVKYTAWYGLVGPWCAMFVSWVADQAKATDIIPRHAYTPSGAAWFQKRRQWGRKPKVGAIVYYEFPGMGRVSHVGIVEAVHSDGSWTAIEGNTDASGGRTGGQVMRKRRRSVGSKGGFGYPKYAPEPKPKARPSDASVQRWQTLLEFAPALRDGDWGEATDERARWMRTAAMHVDSQLGGSARSTVQLIQRVIDTPDDGDWGPASRVAMHKWIAEVQRFLGVDDDGDWGPKTDAAYLAFRTAHYMKF